MNRKLSFYIIAVALLWNYSLKDDQIGLTYNLNDGLNLYLKSLLNHKSIAGFILAFGLGFDVQQYHLTYPVFKNLYLFTLLKFNSLRAFSLNKYLSKRSIFIFSCIFNFFSPNLSIIKNQLKFLMAKKKLNLDQEFNFYLTAIVLFFIKPSFISNYTYSVTFLFWGTFFFNRDTTWIELFFYQIIASLMIAFFNEKYFSCLGFILGNFVIYLYKKVYPYLVITLFITLTGFITKIESFWWYLFKALNFISKIYFWDRNSSTLLLILCLVLIIKTKRLYPLLIFFIFQADWVQTPVIYYLK